MSTKENQGVVEFDSRSAPCGFANMGRSKPTPEEMMKATRSDRPPEVKPAPPVDNVD